MNGIISSLVIIINAIFVNNIVMAQFLGCCPFLGVSKKLDTAVSMGLAVTFVMALSSVITYIIQYCLLVPLHIEYMQTVVFILVIASLVQFVEMVIQKMSPGIVQCAWHLSAADYNKLRGIGLSHFEYSRGL